MATHRGLQDLPSISEKVELRVKQGKVIHKIARSAPMMARDTIQEMRDIKRLVSSPDAFKH